MEVNFCRRCGASLTKKEEGRYICANNHELFYKTGGGLAIGLLLVDESNRLLLATRAINPGKGKLDVPGGFVEFGETLEQAVAREIKEELGLEPSQYSEPQYLISNMNQYPYGGEILYPFDVFFWARMPAGVQVTPQDDVADAQWFNLETFNSELLAFDNARRAIKLLKQKISIA